MKKNNIKKPNLSAKKPSAKGVALKSSNKENGLWLYGFAARIVKGFRQTALLYDDTVKRPASLSLQRGERGNDKGVGENDREVKKFSIFNFHSIFKYQFLKIGSFRFDCPAAAGSRSGREKLKIKNWKFLPITVFALIITGTVVYFSFLPQSVRSKTFPPKADQPRADTFFQTAWSSAAVLVVVLTAYFGHAIIKLINPPPALTFVGAGFYFTQFRAIIMDSYE